MSNADEYAARYDTLPEAIKHLDSKELVAQDAIKLFRHQLQELTGHNPDKTLTALDVVKIVQNTFGPYFNWVHEQMKTK